MSLNSVSQLGEVLGNFSVRQETTKRNLSPDETEGILVTEEWEPGTIEILGTFTVKKWEYESDAFIIDHPVQCDLDSTVYKLDGGYTVDSPTNIIIGDL